MSWQMVAAGFGISVPILLVAIWTMSDAAYYDLLQDVEAIPILIRAGYTKIVNIRLYIEKQEKGSGLFTGVVG